MRHLTLIAFSLAMVLSATAEARPVSYPGGWTGMFQNNEDMNSVHIHYSPTKDYSIGVRSTYHRGDEYFHHGLQLNNLIKRWNMPDAQANLYLKSGLGMAHAESGEHEGDSTVAGFTGLAADWENRRFFISYENRYLEAGDIDNHFEQSGRIGLAPYVGDYGDLHTWLMLEVKHDPESNDNFTVTPLVRFFKDVHLLEAGMNDNGAVLFNYVIRY